MPREILIEKSLCSIVFVKKLFKLRLPIQALIQTCKLFHEDYKVEEPYVEILHTVKSRVLTHVTN